MAQIQKRVGKSGKVTYLIRISRGYDAEGKQRKRSMTWTPEPGMTPRQAERALRAEVLRFEELTCAGTTQDGAIRLQAFARRWMSEYAEKQLKAQTVAGYRRMIPIICRDLGHIRLRELRTGHLNAFYAALQEAGVRRDIKCKACPEFGLQMARHGFTQEGLARASGLSRSTVRGAAGGKQVRYSSAVAMARALGVPLSRVFVCAKGDNTLNPNTVRAYHRLISSMLTKAVKWGYIPFNPAANAELPRLRSKEAVHLDEADARRLLECLQVQPVKYRAPVTLGILSGLRRGELLGLRWRDVDEAGRTVTVVQTSAYVQGQGLCTDTPKNRTSARPLKLSRSAFLVLAELRAWQEERRRQCGEDWQDKDGRVFTNERGQPLHPDVLSKWFRNFARRNGFEGVHVHSLRHTYASLMIADGTPLVVVSRRLGHAQVSTTANIYAHVIASADERAAQVAEKFADIIAGPRRESDTNQTQNREISPFTNGENGEKTGI